ncbi:platelet-derived growth factor receptor alpha-like [Augochlora pura]
MVLRQTYKEVQSIKSSSSVINIKRKRRKDKHVKMPCRHRRFLSAVVLLSYLCRDMIAWKPNMSPSADQIILKEGDSLRLLCYGSSNIVFDYPIPKAHISDAVYSPTSSIEVNKNRDENGTYWYEFHRPHTVFGDTDWYGCSYDPIMVTVHNYSDPKVRWIYVYVQSEEIQFVVRKDFSKMEAEEGYDIIIPCRPTSPHVEVHLKKFIRAKHIYNNIIPWHTYDPKVGFMFKQVKKIHSGTYTCSIDFGNMVRIDLHVSGLPDVPQPIINNTLAHAIKGESVYLKCSIQSLYGVEGYDLFWIPPQQVSIFTYSVLHVY